MSLNGHIKQLKKQGYLVTDLINGKIGEIENSLVDRDNEEIVFVSMSDSFFNINQSSIERLINTYNLQGQTLILLDEVHYGSTSDREYYQDNTGNIPSGYNAVKYHNIVKLLQTCYVLGLTATPTKEQLVDDFGTPLYVPMNTYPPKEELWKRTSSYQTPIFYDWQGWGMEKSLMKFFEMVSDHQTLTDAEADELNLPEECRVKFCGGVKIETPYLNKTKDKEMEKREDVAQAIKRDNPKMPMDQKMAIATSVAKKTKGEDIIRRGDAKVVKVKGPDGRPMFKKMKPVVKVDDPRDHAMRSEAKPGQKTTMVTRRGKERVQRIL